MSNDPRVTEAMRLHKLSAKSHHVWQTLRALGEQDERAQAAVDDHTALMTYLAAEFAKVPCNDGDTCNYAATKKTPAFEVPHPDAAELLSLADLLPTLSGADPAMLTNVGHYLRGLSDRVKVLPVARTGPLRVAAEAVSAPVEEVPPLPEPSIKRGDVGPLVRDTADQDYYTAEQMRAYHATTPPQAEPGPIGDKPLTPFLVKTNTECRQWMEGYYVPEAIEKHFLISLWAWQEQERRYARLTTEPNPTERCKTCDSTGDVHDQTGEWRGECTACDVATIARLRCVCRLLGIETAVPADDATLMGCLFSVLGMMRRVIEQRSAELQEVRKDAALSLSDDEINTIVRQVHGVFAVDSDYEFARACLSAAMTKEKP
jgi:hypothetical protein